MKQRYGVGPLGITAITSAIFALYTLVEPFTVFSIFGSLTIFVGPLVIVLGAIVTSRGEKFAGWVTIIIGVSATLYVFYEVYRAMLRILD